MIHDIEKLKFIRKNNDINKPLHEYTEEEIVNEIKKFKRKRFRHNLREKIITTSGMVLSIVTVVPVVLFGIMNYSHIQSKYREQDRLLKGIKENKIKGTSLDDTLPYKCIKCDKAFRHKWRYELHLRTDHNIIEIVNKKPIFFCKYCNKKFKREWVYNRHTHEIY
jgi:DNA-directed RNA polymerase subunit RPC12/RpoP